MHCTVCRVQVPDDFPLVPSDDVRLVSTCAIEEQGLVWICVVAHKRPCALSLFWIKVMLQPLLFCAGLSSTSMLSSGNSAMLSSLTWCPVCASRTTHHPAQISFSICCPFSWWRPRVFPFSEVGLHFKPGHFCAAEADILFFFHLWQSLYVHLLGNDQFLTKTLSPFDDSVDRNPVVRSVVLKLLLKYRWGALIAHSIRPFECTSKTFTAVFPIFVLYLKLRRSQRLPTAASCGNWGEQHLGEDWQNWTLPVVH